MVSMPDQPRAGTPWPVIPAMALCGPVVLVVLRLLPGTHRHPA